MRQYIEDWNELNPILADGEIGEIIGQLATKTGDGRTRWKDLSYTSISSDSDFVMTTDLTAATALEQDAATAATDTELAAETSARTAADALKQDSATAATDTELTSAVLASKMKPTMKTAAYTAVDRDVVLADTTTVAFTITLPPAAANLQIAVKKVDASVNAVTVSPTSGTIDGAATDVISTQWAVRRYISDGTNWFTV